MFRSDILTYDNYTNKTSYVLHLTQMVCDVFDAHLSQVYNDAMHSKPPLGGPLWNVFGKSAITSMIDLCFTRRHSRWKTDRTVQCHVCAVALSKRSHLAI